MGSLQNTIHSEMRSYSSYVEGDSITPNLPRLSLAARGLLKKYHEAKLDPMGACGHCPCLRPCNQCMAAPSCQRCRREQASLPTQTTLQDSQLVTSPVKLVAKSQLQFCTSPGVTPLRSAIQVSLSYYIRFHFHPCEECTSLSFFTFLSLNLPLLLKWEAVCKRLMLRHPMEYPYRHKASPSSLTKLGFPTLVLNWKKCCRNP